MGEVLLHLPRKLAREHGDFVYEPWAHQMWGKAQPAVLADLRKPITDDKSREILFGKTQYQLR